MANKYIGDVTTSTPALTDFLVGVNGSDAYKTLVSDVAKKIIENYSGSTIGGTAQTIQNAFAGVNDIVGANNLTGYNNRQGWIALTSGQDLNTVTVPGMYYTPSQTVVNSLLNKPINVTFTMRVEASFNANRFIRQIVRGTYGIYSTLTLERVLVDSAWTDWVLQPTRSEVNAIANRGGKNLLPTRGGDLTNNGITFTLNADGSVTANGTATAAASYQYAVTIETVGGRTYTLSGCPEGGSARTYALYLDGAPQRLDHGEGITFTDTQSTQRTARIIVYSGTTVDNLTFYPMLRDASIQDDTYVPYGMSNAELTDKVSVKTKVVEGTTASDGSLGLGLNQEYSVIAVDLGGSGKWGLPFLYNRAWYVRCLNNVAAYQVLASTAVTATVYYFDK